jgi:hypothetical protein
MELAKTGVVLCSHCSLVAHSKCAGRAARTVLATSARNCSCTRSLRSAAAVPLSSSHACLTIIPRARARLEVASNERARTHRRRRRPHTRLWRIKSSRHLSARVLRSRPIRHSPTHLSHSLRSQSPTTVTSVISEAAGSCSSSLRASENRNHTITHLRERRQSISSIGSSCVSSPQGTEPSPCGFESGEGECGEESFSTMERGLKTEREVATERREVGRWRD